MFNARGPTFSALGPDSRQVGSWHLVSFIQTGGLIHPSGWTRSPKRGRRFRVGGRHP